jgi:hypothetical protein
MLLLAVLSIDLVVLVGLLVVTVSDIIADEELNNGRNVTLCKLFTTLLLFCLVVLNVISSYHIYDYVMVFNKTN